jgi:hypothetical protein
VPYVSDIFFIDATYLLLFVTGIVTPHPTILPACCGVVGWRKESSSLQTLDPERGGLNQRVVLLGLIRRGVIRASMAWCY